MGLIRLAAAMLALAATASAARGEDATLSSPIAARVASPAADDARLLALLHSTSRAQAALDPIGNLARGDPGDAALLLRLFDDELMLARRAAVRRSLASLARIDKTRLSAERRWSYLAFEYEARQELSWLAPDLLALTQVRPMTHFGGLHVEFPAMLAPGAGLPYRDEADYRRNLALLRGFGPLLDRAIARFRQGMASGVVETRLTTANMIAQIDDQLAGGVERSPFAVPLEDMPATIPAARRAVLREAWLGTIASEINPAYRRLRSFLADEYLPAARPAIGLGAMKGGSGLYQRLIARHTNLSLHPDEIHALGLAEVARIQREMEAVKARLGFSGTLAAFFVHIQRDPSFHPRSADELALGFAAVARRVEKALPSYFHRLPRAPLAITPFPAARGQFEAGGSYSQGSVDGTRPGVFFYNTYDLPSRFTSGITTLYLHEGLPGHHLQASLAQENTALPDFQRFGVNAAYVEGWALYAETLGFEMGLYEDPRQHWGTLDDEMLRAMRLVVDTGIHARGWTRDQAVDYMLANSGMGRSDAEAEVDRYIANPGQALAYKIGALTIQRLRRKAEAALGPRFDLRDFHAQVLDSGVLPLPVLEAKIDAWITDGRIAPR